VKDKTAEKFQSSVLFDNGETNGNYKSDDKSKTKRQRLPLKPPADLIGPNLSTNAITVLNRRYLKKDDKGKVIETPTDMFWRIARTIASNDVRYEPNIDLLAQAKDYFHTMSRLEFVPNSPTMMNAGRKLGQLAACFVLPVEDSMEAIFETVKNAALVHKSGGGTGFSFSRLRPRASRVASTAGTASGPISFMTVFNAATEAVKQGGTRRGANMGILRVDHPDIKEFITCKRDMVSITNFNISVTITDKFMEAVKNGDKYDLIMPSDGSVFAQEDAREIFDMIAENAWHNGDPGMVFIDEVNKYETTKEVGLVEATNPCGEQPLLPYESCNLGSIDLDKMLTDNLEVDWDKLRTTIRQSVRFLDNIVDQNKFPIEQIKKMTQSNRRIGLGLMGFADLLYAKEIPYNSKEATDLGREIMAFFHKESRQMSDELAVIRGSFTNYSKSSFTTPTRNSTVTTIAPTGTISMIADTSGGIEPNFALVYIKRVMDDDRLLYINRRFEEAAKSGGWYSSELMEKIASGSSLHDLDEVPDSAKRIFVTSHDISPEAHIKMQAAFQEHTENAVSKTINFPNSATIQDVKDSYMLAWSLKCKGITIYRDGSRDVQVMNVGNKLAADAKVSENGTNGSNRSNGVVSDDKKVAPTESSTVVADTKVTDKPISDEKRQRYGKTLKPRLRPLVTHGYTEQILTGDGTLYVTLNEDDYGLCEVFTSLGKSGGNAAAQSEAIGRLISLALRSGIDIQALIKQLKGITSANPVWHEGDLIRSTPDAIGRALERYVANHEGKQQELSLDATTAGRSTAEKIKEIDHPVEEEVKYLYGAHVKEQCPECDANSLIFQEGCMRCTECDYSKCD